MPIYEKAASDDEDANNQDAAPGQATPNTPKLSTQQEEEVQAEEQPQQEQQPEVAPEEHIDPREQRAKTLDQIRKEREAAQDKDNKERKEKGKPKRRSSLFLNVNLQEKILFAKHLGIGVKSGMPLIDALHLIQGQTKSRSMKKILDDVVDDLSRGVLLSESLKKYQNIFGNLFINIVKIAEASGTLPENLNYLAAELKKKHDLRKRVRGAMIYPMVILIMTIAIAIGMILFIFPKILPIFENLNVELPLTTRMLIGFSTFLTNYGVIALGGIVIAFISIKLIIKRVHPIRYAIHSAIVLTPLFGKAMINFNMANITRTLGILLRSGVLIVEGLKITAESLTNLKYQKELKIASEGMSRGVFFSKYLASKKRYFPQLSVNMIEVGENTGNLTENLFYLADFHESELDDFVKNLSSILEPILLLFMGVVVGFIALSFITPMYQLTKGFS
jgi:type IV pilus assembly protein PilC